MYQLAVDRDCFRYPHKAVPGYKEQGEEDTEWGLEDRKPESDHQVRQFFGEDGVYSERTAEYLSLGTDRSYADFIEAVEFNWWVQKTGLFIK